MLKRHLVQITCAVVVWGILFFVGTQFYNQKNYETRSEESIDKESENKQTENKNVIEAYEEDGFYIQTVQSYGYNSEVPITLEVRIDRNTDLVSDVSVIRHEETEDYGGHITEDWFLERFLGKSVYQTLKLVKIMPKEEPDVVAITGATKTSEGMVNGVNVAMENYNNVYGKEME